ncbi:hypothetical protein F183_A12370 [Bryobacterales bacterium F-183]|nr:hypothetical protein F183_A12370 [Bryobacterales bacterium F-183]
MSTEIEPQSWAPMGTPEEPLDFGSSMIDGLYALWLPSGLDPRISYNAAHLNGRRAATPSEFTPAYFRRRSQSSPNSSTIAVPGGLGGNAPTPFGRAFAYSNEQAAMSVGGLGYAPIYSGDGAGKVISVCVWFRINRINGTGFPTILGGSFSTTWWLGIRTSTGKYKAIFRNGSAPYGPFEWGTYNSDLRKICCVTFLLPCDANRTASVFHNGVLAVEGMLSTASATAGSHDVWPLSTATTGMFAEIFGFAAWTRALYAEEIRDLALGPWTLLSKRARFWYAPLMAYRSAQIAAQSGLSALMHRGMTRAASIAGQGSIAAYLRPPDAPERTWRLSPERRAIAPAEEPRTWTIPRERRSIDA